MYIIPPYRFTSYAFGIYLGYILRKYKSHKFSSEQLKLGWFAAGACVILEIIIALFNQTFNPLAAAVFSALAPIPLCVFLMWFIFTAQMGQKSEMSCKFDF